MNHSYEKGFFARLYESYIPNKRDNLKQIILKVLFIVSFVGLVVSTTYIANYFLTAEKESKVINDTREIWYSVEAMVDTDSEEETEEPLGEEISKAALEAHRILSEKNSDFRGWISMPSVEVDNPVYQTKNNSYYLDHNQNKEKSVYGALFFDYNNIVTKDEIDRNLIIYGHEMKNGSMFGSLKKLRNLSFYKENSTVELTLYGVKSTYRIYSVFVLNASKKDDDGYIYNIYRQKFLNDTDFYNWVDEAKERSVIETNVDVSPDDDILTLITCSSDFENSRLVVMAKKLDADEDKSPANSNATTNADPRYPSKWYSDRGIKREEN